MTPFYKNRIYTLGNPTPFAEEINTRLVEPSLNFCGGSATFVLTSFVHYATHLEFDHHMA